MTIKLAIADPIVVPPARTLTLSAAAQALAARHMVLC